MQLLKFTYPSVKTRYKIKQFLHIELFQICKFSDRLSGKKNSKSCSQNHGDRALQVDVGANSHGVVGAGGDPPPDITDFGSWRSGLSAWIPLVPDEVVGSTDYRMETTLELGLDGFFWGGFVSFVLGFRFCVSFDDGGDNVFFQGWRFSGQRRCVWVKSMDTPSLAINGILPLIY